MLREEGSLKYKDLVIPSPHAIRGVFLEILNYMASHEDRATRPEERLNQLSNLLLLKLESDRQARAQGEDAHVRWQKRKGVEETARFVREWFADFAKRHPEMFRGEGGGEAQANAQLNLGDGTIHHIVASLERYLLLGNASSEAVSQAFQVLRTEALRSADGQFFTPQPVVESATKLVLRGTGQGRLMIDPACGTGAFLLQAFREMQGQFTESEGQITSWKQTHLYGVDRDGLAVKLAKAVMQMAGDGSAHVFRGDSVRTYKWNTEYPHLQAELVPERFDFVLTNPPFGKPLKVSFQDLDKSGYTIHKAAQRAADGQAKGEAGKAAKGEFPGKEKGLEIGLVFLELAYRLLKPGGRLGIILPESYFFSNSYSWLFEWLKTRFRPLVVVNVPMEAFQEYARAKTNFYVFEKVAGEGFDPDWKVVFLNPRTCGIDQKGKYTEDNELKDHIDAYLKGGSPRGYSEVRLEEVYRKKILVPRYWDQSYLEPLQRFLSERGLTGITLGELVDAGVIQHFYGHGSPELTERGGSVPYVKVSDLRSGRVNVNPTNLVSAEVAEALWKGKESGLRPWDVLTPARASNNIGEFAILLPGEERVVLTKEILGLRVVNPQWGFDPFYLFWALSLRVVRNSWRRITLMQTNREDIGGRWREIVVPMPKSPEWALEVSRPIREYLLSLSALAEDFRRLTSNGQYELIPGIFSLHQTEPP